MNHSRLAYLFQAFIHKTATAAEQDELMVWLEQPENEERAKEMLSHTWEQYSSQSQPFTESQGEEMLSAILQQSRSGKVAPVIATKSASIGWRRVAAAAAILLVIGTGGYFWLTGRQAGQSSTSNQPVAQTAIAPGSDKAVLTLANGSRIILDTTRQGTLTQQGNAKVINVNAAVLAYNEGSDSNEEIVYNTLSTPRGGQYQLQLADGTNVWLNASSSIRFPVTFTGKERNVSITGEAYFEVAKNAAMPFTVTVKDATVKVLGTHFNVMAYEDEHTLNTTLLEGSVKIYQGGQKKLLLPGQQSQITRSGQINIKEADTEEVMAWKNGWFLFNSADIETIMRQVARWYDVDVVYKGPIPAGHFSGIVSRKNNIAQVLKIMQGSSVHFSIDGRKVIVTSNPQ
ncbi:FecR family protein [Paraflavitalea sp. CAU 1676]|uniref:FecR family protein n=1 Tax=Paraflavitalea sp. CAU 1676 TaxID=3032598 RepID=UPI0023DA46EB|nr:FecR family protein [Paraflavitalea sp. CAU 1676]MDF2188217.1 FecR domain-containing protein [Paraflavitalea sp. CAU 1676]